MNNPGTLCFLAKYINVSYLQEQGKVFSYKSPSGFLFIRSEPSPVQLHSSLQEVAIFSVVIDTNQEYHCKVGVFPFRLVIVLEIKTAAIFPA